MLSSGRRGRNSIHVEIDAHESVGNLTQVITATNMDMMCAASQLRLYLAKKGHEPWLDCDGADAVTLDDDGNPRDFDKMDPARSIRSDRYFGKDFEPKEG